MILKFNYMSCLVYINCLTFLQDTHLIVFTLVLKYTSSFYLQCVIDRHFMRNLDLNSQLLY